MATTAELTIHSDHIDLDARAVLAQITRGGLMTVGASDICLYKDAVTMKARIHPRLASGKRAGAARVMDIKITLNSWDLYCITVSYFDRRALATIVHWEIEGAYAEDLARYFLSLDSGTESRD